MEMSDVAGLGPAKVRLLAEAGIHTVPQLASMDLRKKPDINIGAEVLKRAKKDARRMCDAAGVRYAKAPYAEDGVPNSEGGSAPHAEGRAKTSHAKDQAPQPPRPGILRRLLGRA